jgi:hypothetical protein
MLGYAKPPPNLRENAIALKSIEPATLLADGFPLSEVGSSFNSTIEHNSFINKIHTTTDQVVEGRSRSSEISLNQNGMFKRSKFSSTKDSMTSVHMIQVGSPQVGFSQMAPTQVSGKQISIPYDGTIQPSPFQVSTKQIGSSQISSAQIGLSQIGSAQVDISQNSAFEINRTVEGNTLGLDQLNPSKIALSISIPSQQFFSSNFPDHNLTSNFFSNFQYNATNLWQSLFDPTFNLTLQITDLPTGQLAEAQITKFDQYGRPNGGTLLIDADANGVGWFIDQTPWENSEFAQTLTDTAYRATTGEAAGKYDLLTTILHETGHLLGIISGNPEFDKRIQTINGKRTFVGDGFSFLILL